MFRAIVNTVSLRNAITLAAKSINKRSAKPILTCVKLSTVGSTVMVSATNLESAISIEVREAQIESDGAILVNADLLLKTLRATTESIVLMIESINGTVEVSGNSVSQLPTFPVADYPPIPTTNVYDTSLPAAAMRGAIDRTVFAAAKESTRYAFNGIQLRANGKLVVTATDGRRLATTHAETSEELPIEKSMILPALAAKLLATICKGAKKDDCQLALNPYVPQPEDKEEGHGTFSFRTGGITLYSLNVIGRFPEYEDVIPREPSTTLCAGRESLLASVERVGQVVDENRQGLRLIMLEGCGMELSANNPEGGKASENIACPVTGEPLEIGFNPSFLADGLRAAPGDDVRISFNAANRPALIESGDYRYVVMPVNLQA